MPGEAVSLADGDWASFLTWVRADLHRHAPCTRASVTAENVCPAAGCILQRHEPQFNHRTLDGRFFSTPRG